MGFFDTAFNSVPVGNPASPTAVASIGSVPGSGDSIITVGGYQVDMSFLDALYAGGKLSAVQRDQILAGQDPGSFSLVPYDLYYLTCGRLGSKTGTTGIFPLIGTYSLTLVYQVGQLVTYQPAGAMGVYLYQAIVQVPAGTAPTNTSYWVQVSGAAPLLDTDVLNPVLAAVSAPSSGILALQQTSGTVLAGVIVPSGRTYRVTVSEARPNNRGGSTPTDSNVRLVPLITEQVNGDGSTTVTITPRWSQIAVANAAAIAAVSAASLNVRLTVTVQ